MYHCQTTPFPEGSDEIATDIVDQVVDMFKVASSFALQLDKSTDISGQAQLVAFMRYRDTDDICEHVLFCKSLTGKTTGEDINVKVFSVIAELAGISTQTSAQTEQLP